jgi:hypothetical protein
MPRIPRAARPSQPPRPPRRPLRQVEYRGQWRGWVGGREPVVVCDGVVVHALVVLARAPAAQSRPIRTLCGMARMALEGGADGARARARR